MSRALLERRVDAHVDEIRPAAGQPSPDGRADLGRLLHALAGDSRAAVHRPWHVYIALPSPIIAMTGRSGNASLTPIAAGRPQPMPPPRRPKKLLESSHRKK